jgi:uncharacterized protein (TIGR02271 family)
VKSKSNVADSASKPDKAQTGAASDDPSEKAQAGEVSNTAPTEPETIRLLAEELSVGQRQIETGRVRVKVVTHETEELVDVPLARERVTVNRVAVGRQVDAIPPIREEGDTIIVPVVEEVVVVERRLMLKEELYIKRERSTERHQERVRLRHQEAEVTRIPSETADAGMGPAHATVVEPKRRD